MAEAVATVFKTIFGTVGLTSPLTRFLAVTGLFTGAEFLVKPRYAFDDQGQLRPWAIPFTTSQPGAVYTPVGFYPALLGLISALFV